MTMFLSWLFQQLSPSYLTSLLDTISGSSSIPSLASPPHLEGTKEKEPSPSTLASNYFWLVPQNDAARHIVQLEQNASVCDIIPRRISPDTLSSTSPTSISESGSSTASTSTTTATVPCVRIPLGREKRTATPHDNEPYSLFTIGGSLDSATYDLSSPSFSSCFSFYLDPSSGRLLFGSSVAKALTAVISDKLANGKSSALLLYPRDCPRVGCWEAVGQNIRYQTIIPGSDLTLRIAGADFAFLWNKPGDQQNYIEASKHHPMTSNLSEQEAFQLGKVEYPRQLLHQAKMGPLSLFTLPEDIRYLIFRTLTPSTYRPSSLHVSDVATEGVSSHSLHTCVDLLNASSQLLNPAYSSPCLATEFARVFYRHAMFDVNILELPHFLWTLSQMPLLLDGFKPHEAITRLALRIHATPPTDARSTSARTPNGMLEWTGPEKELFKSILSKLQVSLPNLKHLQISIYKQGPSSPTEVRSYSPSAEPPLHIYHDLKPFVESLSSLANLHFEVLLHSRLFPAGSRRNSFSSLGGGAEDDGKFEDMVQDIRSWWDPENKAEDEALTSSKNIRWMWRIDWPTNHDASAWKRKTMIEGARMRRMLHGASWSLVSR